MTKLPTPKIIDNNTKVAEPRKKHSYGIPHGMAFVSSENKQVCGFVGCRDYLQDTVRTYLNDKKRLPSDGHSYHPESGDPDLCMDRLRLMFTFKKTLLKSFLRGLKVINSFETYAEMETTIGEFVCTETLNKTSDVVVLLRGSGEYMKNPHLLSMLTLIIRFCTYNPVFKYEQLSDFVRAYNSMKKRKTIVKDAHLMTACYEIMHEILKNRKTIFKNCTMDELFPTGIKHEFHSKGGIFELCKSNSPNNKVNKKIVELKRKIVNS